MDITVLSKQLETNVTSYATTYGVSFREAVLAYVPNAYFIDDTQNIYNPENGGGF